MARSGGLLGEAGRRITEVAAERVGLLVVPSERYPDVQRLEQAEHRIVEAEMDSRLARRQLRHLGQEALTAIGQREGIQDLEPDDRIGMARQARYVAQRDSHIQFALRLRSAFCFGRGIPKPEAADSDVQARIDAFWTDEANKRELTTHDAQKAKGWALWTQCNVFPVVFDDGLDGMVRLGHLEHDSVVGTVKDRDVAGRVLYYKVRQWVPAPWDWTKHAPSRQGRWRIVYYESFQGFAELEAEQRNPPEPAPEALLQPGRVLHVAINRGEEQAFGVPELRANMKWAAAFNDLMLGQVEKAKAVQRFLMKVKAKGATTGNRLMTAAMNAVNRRSPLGSAPLVDAEGDPARLPEGAKPGSELWENDTLTAEPFTLDSGASNAAQDMQGAVDAFAAGTNYPGYYFHGDPGALAGATAAELPVLKLTDSDHETWEGVVRTVLDHHIRRSIEVGLLTERRTPTPEEIARNVEVGPDGLVERDLTFTVNMPDALRRNLPELSQLISDTGATFDPMGGNRALNRYLLAKALTTLFDVADPSPIVDDVFPEDDGTTNAPDPRQGGGGPPGPGTTGPDGQRHTGDNPYGARQQGSLVEAAMSDLAGRLLRSAESRAREHDAEFARLLGAPEAE